MERTKFACLTCLNAGTPVCEECHVIEKPSGRSTRPTRYCGDDRTPENGLSPGDVSAILLVRLQCGKPLPLKWVMRYNECCVSEAQAERSRECVGDAGRPGGRPLQESESAEGECGTVRDRSKPDGRFGLGGE